MLEIVESQFREYWKQLKVSSENTGNSSKSVQRILEQFNNSSFIFHLSYSKISWFSLGQLAKLRVSVILRICHVKTKLNKCNFGTCLRSINTNSYTKILYYFIKGSVTVHLTSCFICLDLAALLMFNQQQIYLIGQIQTH